MFNVYKHTHTHPWYDGALKRGKGKNGQEKMPAVVDSVSLPEMSILVLKYLRNSQNATIFGNRLFKELGYNEHTQVGTCNQTSVL